MRNLKREGAQFQHFFSNVVFFGRANLKQIENKKGTYGSGDMLSRKIFEILHAVMAILVHFEYFSGKFCLNFLTLILIDSPNKL